MSIPENFGDLLSWEKKSFAHLALVLRDGTPQCTPLWFHYDGTHIIINSALGRVKDKAMRQTPHVALAISDPDNPYRYIQIRGKVVEITEEGARATIDHLSEIALPTIGILNLSPHTSRIAGFDKFREVFL